MVDNHESSVEEVSLARSRLTNWQGYMEQELIVAQLDNQFPGFYGCGVFINMFTKPAIPSYPDPN
jgi:hypothetical protein